MPIVAFAVLLALPLWAQHGGGHAVGGHGGGFAGHGGFRSSGGVHVSGAMHSAPSRSFTRAPSFSQRSFSHRPFLHDGFRGPRERRFRSDCRGFDCRAWGWGWGGYYDPFWWGDSSSSYDEDYERDRAIANEMNEQSLEEQRMRQQEQGSDQDSYNDGQNRYTRSAPGSRDPGRRVSRRSDSIDLSRSAQTGNPQLRHRRSDAVEFFARSIRKRFRYPIWTCPRPRKPTTIAA